MLSNHYAAATKGVPRPVLYRVPPPHLPDPDDPIVEAATQLCAEMPSYYSLVRRAEEDGTWPRDTPEPYAIRVFWQCLYDIATRNEAAMVARALLLDSAYVKSNVQPYRILERLPPHPGKALPYPVEKLSVDDILARHPELEVHDFETAFTRAARRLYPRVQEFADYCFVRWLDYEHLQAQVFLRHLALVITDTRRRCERVRALRARLEAQGLPLTSRPND
jgi:hypothetical protein